ncbi:MAG TPA: phenylalanine--tRNA ligase subunit beta [Ktedonobacteraceae bacterium]|jgi:phenylalanyl-tRNA synthetase beta chain|nr:phenylalanine--tRNA ligase subunit beta [Ktedonobacteraceae bacterium]
MLVPISWLKEYVDLDMPLKELADRITLAGLEVEAIEQAGEWWDPEHIVVGRILAVKAHPNADRLVLVDVDYGGPEPEQVVTGAPNLFQYKDQENLPVLKVAFARAGAVLIDAYSDERPRPKKKLKPSKIRGVPSNGMVCSERELGLSEEHEGILLLPEDAPVGKPLRDYLGDEVFEIGLTPDMARCLNMIGIAREVSALTGAKLHLPPDGLSASNGHVTTSSVGENTEDYVDVRIENPDLCNRYTAMIIKNVRVGESPRWMQDRLIKAGMRPISNIVDITNYVMLEWGQPLHAFDYDLLKQRAERSGRDKPEIIVRTATTGEKMTTLDGVEREFDESILLITDTLGPVAIAGVMGGEETEVNAETRNVLLESATFDGINNRRTSQKLKLISEASQRFTRGIPATLNPIAARRAASLMREYAGGAVVPGIVDDYPVPQHERVVYTTESDIRRLLGMDVTLPEIAADLQRLGIESEKLSELPGESSAPGQSAFGLNVEAGEPVLRCIAPWHRLDIQVPADLAEEVARMIGYEHIATTLMGDVLPPPHRNLALETEEKIRDILVGCGLQETIGYSLTIPEHHDILNREPTGTMEKTVPYITLVNPLSINRRVMRRTLLVTALENLAYNYRYTQRQAVFEIGRVYLPEESKGIRPKEERRFSLLLTGPRQLVNIQNASEGTRDFDFFDLKGIVETLLRRLGFSDSEFEFVVQPDRRIFTRVSADLKIRGEPVGILGELHPEVQLGFDVPGNARVYLAEIRIDPLIQPGWRIHRMEPISNYPPVVEDLAFVVAEEVTAAQVLEAIRKAGGSLLTNIELFDVYRGQPIPAGQKSLAYRLTYENPEAPLKESQVVAIRNRIIQRVKDAVGGVLRE